MIGLRSGPAGSALGRVVQTDQLGPSHPPTKQLRVLLVEDSVDDAYLILRALEGSSYRVEAERVQTAEAMAAALTQMELDLVIADYNMPSFSGIAALRLLQSRELDLPFILVSGTVGEDIAVEAMRHGAHDYIMKRDLRRLAPAVERELREAANRREHRIADAKLHQTVRDLARANAELENFAYLACHDLQEPLRMVICYTELLSRRYRGKLGPDADEFIDFASDGAARMRQLIMDLLAHMRVGAASLTTVVDTGAALRRAIGNLQHAIQTSGAEILSDPLPSILATEVEVVQLFQNLIGNAIKYRSESQPEIRVSAEAVDDAWVFTIRDNGIGIEPQYFDMIFAIFRRIHPLEKYPGTGVGLAICKKIVERHGGKIWVESKIGCGSAFCFRLPADPADSD